MWGWGQEASARPARKEVLSVVLPLKEGTYGSSLADGEKGDFGQFGAGEKWQPGADGAKVVTVDEDTTRHGQALCVRICSNDF